MATSSLDGSAQDRGALRDLMGLLALPALWAGKDAQTMFELMAGAIRSIVPVEVAFAEVRLRSRSAPIPVLRLGAAAWTTEFPPDWAAFADTCRLISVYSDRGVAIPSPLGELRVLRFHMGAGARDERIWFGSRAPDFPTLTQLAFMRAAVSLAVSGLQTAHAEQERADAMRAKDEFLALLGHELRNPLAPIVTALGLIRLKGAGELAEEVALIDRQVHHLSRLVDDLLDITRITRDRVDLKLEVFALRRAVLDAVETVAPLVEDRRHAMHVNLDELTGTVNGDAHRLRQLFTNLLINAAKYTPPGGEIRLAASQAEGIATITVRDNGIGMAPDLLPRVFNLFQQGKVALDRADGGLGIGLALVHKLVVLHEGTVAAQSDGPGRGATLTVRLPLHEPQAGPPEAAAAPAETGVAAAPGRRVLLVDDNRDALETLAALLGMFGFEVMTAGEGSEALAKGPAFEPDAVILDIGLPGMDGYELSKRLHECGGPLERATFIALTGYGQETDRSRALAAGFDRHLVKPVQIDELLAALAHNAPTLVPSAGA